MAVPYRMPVLCFRGTSTLTDVNPKPLKRPMSNFCATDVSARSRIIIAKAYGKWPPAGIRRIRDKIKAYNFGHNSTFQFSLVASHRVGRPELGLIYVRF